jgi:hypothetical protein
MSRLTSRVSITGSSIFIGPDEPRVKRIKPDGTVVELPPFWPWDPLEDGRELYAVRGFHQMHCIVCTTFTQPASLQYHPLYSPTQANLRNLIVL